MDRSPPRRSPARHAPPRHPRARTSVAVLALAAAGVAGLLGAPLASPATQAVQEHSVAELMVFPDDVHDSLLFHRWVYTFEPSADFLRRTLGDGERIATEEERGGGAPR